MQLTLRLLATGALEYVTRPSLSTYLHVSAETSIAAIERANRIAERIVKLADAACRSITPERVAHGIHSFDPDRLLPSAVTYWKQHIKCVGHTVAVVRDIAQAEPTPSDSPLARIGVK